MIPNHKQFIEAIKEKKKVCLRFYSKADSEVIDLVCAPLDYGPEPGIADGVNRYSLWDYTNNTGSHILSLLPSQVLDVRVLGEVFDPAQIDVRTPHWFIDRTWGIEAGSFGVPKIFTTQLQPQNPHRQETAANESKR